jgi:hypothetical protein
LSIARLANRHRTSTLACRISYVSLNWNLDWSRICCLLTILVDRLGPPLDIMRSLSALLLNELVHLASITLSLLEVSLT